MNFINKSVSYSKFGSTRTYFIKSYPFLRASRDSIVTNADNLEAWGVEIKCSSSKLDQSINDVLKDKKST